MLVNGAASPANSNHSGQDNFLYTRIQGDTDARNSLINSHLGKVALIARKLAARRPVEWEDLAQEGVKAMLEAAERFDPDKGEFWPFVYHAVLGAMLNFRGADCRETFHVELSGVRVFATESGEEMSERLSRELDLARAMERLTTKEKRVFTALREGHRPREIAGMLRIHEGTVSRLRKRVIERVRAELVA